MANENKWLDFLEPKYEEMFNIRLMTHEYFQEWVKNLDIKTGLEIGGGMCEHRGLFKEYVNIDINENLKEEYTINMDFLNYKSNKKYDLVFSHAVLDHSENPNLFLIKSITRARKYVFHSIYRGLQRQSLKHLDPIIDNDGYIYNQLSEFEIKRVLKDFDHKLIKLDNGNVCLIVKR